MAYVAMADMQVADLFMTFSGGNKTLVKLNRGEVLPVDLLDEKDVKKSLRFGALGRLIAGGWIEEVEDSKAEEFCNKVKATFVPSIAEKALSAEEKAARSRSEISSSGPKRTFVENVSAEELHEIRQSRGMVENLDLTKNAGKAVDVEDVQFEKAIVSNKGGGLSTVEPEKNVTQAQDKIVDEKRGTVHTIGVNLQNYDVKSDLGKVNDYSSFDQLNHFDQLLFIKETENKGLLTEISEKNGKKQIQNNARKKLSELG